VASEGQNAEGTTTILRLLRYFSIFFSYGEDKTALYQMVFYLLINQTIKNNCGNQKNYTLLKPVYKYIYFEDILSSPTIASIPF
jgi:hypothetical protein